ncbi:protein spinster homolog 1 [Struthio camelus]|uniref:protein spinster homolog 1 n=1 Tax=Struthio camelus TaxID=8801 RepID=UPI003603DBAD
MATGRAPPPAAGPVLRRADDTGGDGAGAVGPEPPGPPPGVSPRRARLTAAVLCYVNLLNYMDRFTVAGVLPDIEAFFDIGDGSSGLLQTVFISSYMVLAPVFGYLGDRRSRKRLLCLGIALWSAVTLASSFVPRQRFWALLVARALVGVGEASYSTVAPTLIADLFAGTDRSRVLGCFYLAVPLGSGLGYIAGAKVKEAAADWHWALRVTPGLGLVAVVLLLAVVQEPPRGAMERGALDAPLRYTSWAADLRALATNRSFVLSTLGFTAVAFVTGALALWAPAFLYRSRLASGAREPCPEPRGCHADESLIFGALTCVTGVLGVGAGVELSRRLRPVTPRADPLLCAAGLLGSAPFLFLAVVCARATVLLTYVFIFIGETLLSLNWAIVADILLYVVAPTRRSTAEALQIVVSHLLGDAGSPYLIGVISDRLRRGAPDSFLAAARALERALLLCAFAGALGGAFFLAAALFLEGDRRRAQLDAQRSLPAEDGDDGEIVVPQRGRPTKVPVSSVLI